MSPSELSTSHEEIWDFLEQVILLEAVKYQVRSDPKITPLGDLLEDLVQKAPLRKVYSGTLSDIEMCTLTL